MTRSTSPCRPCPGTASPASRPRSAGMSAASPQARAELMRRLGYPRYVAQGGGVGASVTDAMGRQGPGGLAGIHMNLLVTALGGGAHAGRHRAGTRGPRADQDIPGERLRLLPGAGHTAADDRLRPAGFTRRPGRLDARPRHRRLRKHHPRLRRQAAVRWSHPGPHPRQHHHVLADAAPGPRRPGRTRKTGEHQALAAGQPPPQVKLSVGFTTFPGEIFRAPRSWVEASYPTLTYFNEAARGGHFAAWEEPELFATEIRAAFTALRYTGRPHLDVTGWWPLPPGRAAGGRDGRVLGYLKKRRSSAFISSA